MSEGVSAASDSTVDTTKAPTLGPPTASAMVRISTLGDGRCRLVATRVATIPSKYDQRRLIRLNYSNEHTIDDLVGVPGSSAVKATLSPHDRPIQRLFEFHHSPFVRTKARSCRHSSSLCSARIGLTCTVPANSVPRVVVFSGSDHNQPTQ